VSSFPRSLPAASGPARKVDVTDERMCRAARTPCCICRDS